MIVPSEPAAARFGNRPLHELFEWQVAETPDRIALVCDGSTLSYRILNERANQLAHHLQDRGVGPGTLVAVHLQRSLELVVALLAVLKTGAAYLPLDLENPPERLSTLIQDASPAVTIVHASLVERVSPAGAVIVVDPERPWFEQEPSSNPRRDIDTAQAAYVIYTSGSTGTPKGVVVEHRSVVALFNATEPLYRFDADDVWTLFHSTAFDFSVWEMWGALLHGARLVVVPHATARSPEDFHALCVRERVTVLNQTPSVFQAFMRADASSPDRASLTLRYVTFGGEALNARSLQPWFALHGDQQPQMINMYGITETTVHVTFKRLTASDAEDRTDAPSLIGRPIPGYYIRLLVPESAPRPAASGDVGEIAVGGVGVARGYLERPELTAQRFVRDALSADPDARLYRSGDLGRLLPNGELEYLGRGDQQVKMRGFRIEPGEIEAVLRRHASVAESVVIASNDGDDKRLLAYWVRRPGRAPSPGELRAHVAVALPSYMVPSAFIELAHLPLTSNGKLDRNALPGAPTLRDAQASEYEVPQGDVETELAAIWSEVLRLDRIGRHDDFFALGGHSLLATQVAVRVRARLGVHLALSLLFDRPTIAGLAASLARAQRHAVSGSASVSATGPSRGPRRYLMSFPQRSLWFAHQLFANRGAYVLPYAWRLHGVLDAEALAHALDLVVSRHAALRTRFTVGSGEPMQIVDDPRSGVMVHHDLSGLPRDAREAEAARLTAEEATRPFDLATEWPLRARLLVLDTGHHVLLLTAHHMASDAWSENILHRELAVLYRSLRSGAIPLLEPLPTTYGDFAVRQRNAMTAAREEELLKYWRQRLAALTPLELPADRPRPIEWSSRGAAAGVELSGSLLSRLHRLASETHVTLQMLLLAAFQVVLARYSGQSDIAVATFTAGRDAMDVEGVVGVFVNQIIVRVDLSGRPTFRDVLDRVRVASLGAYDHQDLPFERLVADLHPHRRPGQNPIAPVAFQLLPIDDGPLALDGLEVVRVPSPDGQVRFDLELTIRSAEGGLRGSLGYSTDRFDQVTIDGFLASYCALLESVTSMPDEPVDNVPLATAAECDQQLRQWSGAFRPFAAPGLIHERFATQTEATPDAPAVRFGDHRMTYRQLWQSARLLAQRLRTIGVVTGAVVAVHLDRSLELVASLLAILDVGAAYLPLDPSDPEDRLGFVVRDMAVDVVITDRPLPASLAGMVRHVILVPDESLAAPAPDEFLPAHRGPAAAAYVMYTSGSTGQPKGVAIPHQAILRLVQDTNYIQIDRLDRVAQASSAAFDAATFEIWGALLNGAELVGIERDALLSSVRLAETIRDRGITVLFLTTALFHEAAAIAPWMFAPLRCLLVGGEVLDPASVDAVRSAGPPRHLIHVYGPTENTTFSTAFEVTQTIGASGAVPIGRPIAGTSCYVLDAHRALLPVGAIGELYVGGPGLATGYTGRAALTDERFVAHPFVAGERLYATGDRVRWRADGVLHFIGRFDRQIKLRGYRIEVDEIEETLRRHAGIAACVVVLMEDRRHDKQLVAYWVSRGESAPTADELREHLRRQLPLYMVPAVLVELSTIPLTVNGKVDRAALPAPAVWTPPSSVAPESATALEAIVMAAYAEVLGLPYVDRRTSFFDLGGTSLLVFRLIERISVAAGRRASVADVFSHSSAADLAAQLARSEATHSGCAIIEVRRGASKTPLYFPPDILGQGLVDDGVLQHLSHDQPIFVFADPASAVAPPRSMEMMAERLCQELCRFQPDGAICLAGYSFAGLLAYEMARQLTARGRRIQLLAIFDTGPDQADMRTMSDVVTRIYRFLENVPRWVGEDLVRTFDQDTPARLRRSLRKLVRRLHHTAEPGVTHDRVDDLFDTSQWTAPLRAHVENNLQALEAFRYGTYPGAVLIFRARVRPLFNDHSPDLGWSALAPNLRVVDMPGNHHSMMQEPHIHAVARALSEALAGSSDGCRTESPALAVV